MDDLKLFSSLQQKILSVFVILVLPLITLLVYYNVYTIEVIRNQVAYSNKNLLSLYTGVVDKNLEDVDKYLYSLIAQEQDLLILDRPEVDDPTLYNMARIRLFIKLSKDVVNYEKADMIFIYSEKNKDLVTAENHPLSSKDQHVLKSEILSIFNSNDSIHEDRWFLYNDRAEPSLYRLLKYGNVYVGALFNMDKLMVPFDAIHLGEKGKIVAVNQDGVPVETDPFLTENKIELKIVEGAYNMTGANSEFITVSADSRLGNFTMIAVIHERQILENIPYLRRIAYMIIIGTIIVLPIVYIFLRQTVLVPMRRVVTAMRKIKSGDWETRIEPKATSDEFAIVNESFNHMVSQIKALKISVYEEQLNHQRAELKHLQLQINPHFFLNSFNIIYQLAQVKNFELIQEMTLSLVGYFRYMFRSNLTFVPLKDEIEHTRNYLRIQEMRFPGKLTFELLVQDELLKGMVPPLVCQTFVENAMKHAVSMDHALHIAVQVCADPENLSFMLIQIEDTGKGFPAEVLIKLQQGIDLETGQGHHIGIWNMRRRLRLLYPNGNAGITFMNGMEQGAAVRIRLPIAAEL
ncbi:histidine kinase [Paenibacillus sp.]|uniref:sensor histidine kinase n=1 Tax=Paenibacillus sp. TaxID=58172 RepID=UPI0028111F5C|nr:histidine kinase [Paenibacillus sp.]